VFRNDVGPTFEEIEVMKKLYFVLRQEYEGQILYETLISDSKRVCQNNSVGSSSVAVKRKGETVGTEVAPPPNKRAKG
jgi:hypothetical protein